MEAFAHNRQLTGMRMFEVDETTNIIRKIGKHRLLAAYYAVKFTHSMLTLPQLTELLEKHHPCYIHHRQCVTEHYFEVGLVVAHDLSWWDSFAMFVKANTGEEPMFTSVRTVDYFKEDEDPLLIFSVYSDLMVWKEE